MSSPFEYDGVVINNKEVQDARAYLRERFLRCISSISDKRCEMKTVEKTDLSGDYQGMDLNVQNIFVKNLKTPSSDGNTNLVRTSDILYIKFPDILCQSKPDTTNPRYPPASQEETLHGKL